ncbi:MAG: hypothetical protein QOI24_2272 [Acidobacteriota bacterium]|nr:hypothetical protein [Acidobacteriota bacterium]
MGAIERIGDFRADAEYLWKRKRSAGERVGQRFAIEVLHHEVVDSILMADVVQHADVRVIEPGDGARLAVEALFQVRAA